MPTVNQCFQASFICNKAIFRGALEENHTRRQEAANNWRSFLQKAIQAQRTDELSDDPMTQNLLRQLQEENRE